MPQAAKPVSKPEAVDVRLLLDEFSLSPAHVALVWAHWNAMR